MRPNKRDWALEQTRRGRERLRGRGSKEEEEEEERRV